MVKIIENGSFEIEKDEILTSGTIDNPSMSLDLPLKKKNQVEVDIEKDPKYLIDGFTLSRWENLFIVSLRAGRQMSNNAFTSSALKQLVIRLNELLKT